MTSKWLKSSIGPIGLFGIFANYGYHHQKYIQSLFNKDKQDLLPSEPVPNFELPADFEKNIDSFCEDIEKNLSKYPKKTYDLGIEAQGDFKFRKDNDRPDGKGVINVLSQGYRMIGEFSNGQLNGIGIAYNQNNRLYYKGILNNGSLDGLGILDVSDDFLYKGNFEKLKPKGSGKYSFKDGRECVITGSEKLGAKDFAVCHDEKKALKYKGEWEDGDFNGKGTFYYTDGSRYEGDFFNGTMHGDGKLFDKYGDIVYRGEFKNDQKQNFLNYFSEPIIAGAFVFAYILVRTLP